MGKAPAIYEKTGKPYRSDRQLVSLHQNPQSMESWKDATYELWDKYKRVVSIGKRELIALCKRNSLSMPDVLEEYEALFWEKFILQLQGIELSRVNHLPNWSMYIRVLGYLKAMNRDQVKAHIKWEKNKEEIIESIESASTSNTIVSNIDKQSKKNYLQSKDSYEDSINKEIFWECIEELKNSISQKQKLILNLKLQKKYNDRLEMYIVGLPNYEIQAKLNLTPNEYSENLSIIKSKFVGLVKQISLKHGLEDLDYKKLCIELQ